ncbi:MAG TPA: peptide transporter, partial [Candidatus Latescibacteria bacterium]|nr:peptide transporter [Candidatus Latescibacterota bacterium]
MDIYYDLAQTYEQMKDLEEAHEAYMQVIMLDPLHLEARASVSR